MIARVAIGALALLVVACGRPIQPWEYSPRPMADTLAIAMPQEQQSSLIYEQLFGLFKSLDKSVNLNRRFGGGPEALNVDPFDEVVNSTWFTNRNAVDPLTPEEVFRGPQTVEGPDQSGPVVIKSIKAEGVTPGFNIEDARGDRYIVKFDPPEHAEMASGAEVVGTNLFWAAGYNTPENYVFHLDPARLTFDDDLEADFAEDGELIHYRVGGGEDARPLTMEVFERHILSLYPRRPDGTIRALASKFLEGIPIGPFAWTETRNDDPNDVIPHDHRRELRGLYTMASWLNHVDAKKGNTLDMFILDRRSPEGAPRIGYVRHNLIDFGSTLGSGSVRPHNPRHGTESDIDAAAAGLRLVTFGLYRRPWQDMDMDPPGVPPSIGYYQIDNYFPGDWRPNISNAAFGNRTPRDAYWGAKLVMSFTDEQLAAAVRAGRYSDPAAAAYLLEGLKERRDATGRYWFRQVSPLDDPRVEGDAVAFDDLWIRHFGGPAAYRWELEWDAFGLEADGAASAQRIPLPPPPSGGSPDPDDAHARLEIWKIFGNAEEADRPATIWLARDGAAWRVVGVRY